MTTHQPGAAGTDTSRQALADTSTSATAGMIEMPPAGGAGLVRPPVAVAPALAAASPATPGGGHPGFDRREELRQHIAANVVGDDPPPLTPEACDLIRAVLGPGHAVEDSRAA